MKMRNMFLCYILIFVFIFPIQASAYEYNEKDVIIDFLPGDIDGNYRVNSADARLCLRAAASLEALTAEQIKAADLDGTGEIKSANARSILRACAKLEPLTITVNIEQGQRIVVGPLKNTPGGFVWTSKTDSSKTTITRTSENNLLPEHVGLFDQFFTIITDEDNSFIATILQECPWTGEIYCSFNLNIVFSS